jgi:putative endonuclease
MSHNQALGKLGEELAVNYLIGQGYEIVTTNYRMRRGEIDIIATQGKSIIFCEVKTRASLKYGTPASAVTHEKRKHIVKVAHNFLNGGQWEDYCPRFDVIEVYKFNNGHINHMVNAYVIDD